MLIILECCQSLVCVELIRCENEDNVDFGICAEVLMRFVCFWMWNFSEQYASAALEMSQMATTLKRCERSDNVGRWMDCATSPMPTKPTLKIPGVVDGVAL